MKSEVWEEKTEKKVEGREEERGQEKWRVREGWVKVVSGPAIHLISSEELSQDQPYFDTEDLKMQLVRN